MTISVVPLGAGQDVGRSCVVVSLGGRNIMFDCGMHMGFSDDRRFPDFSYISKGGRHTEMLDCIIITHFHLDHCGALPYFTEICGYDGPIYMTHPTKAICPILLEDYRKITVERKGETNFFTSHDLKNCMKKVIGVDIHQTIKIDDDMEIRAYYAGHVLGAAMFYVRVGSESVVYTGDYNMTPDRHLGAAWIDRCRPDLLITETTYATTIRDSKRARERDFLKKVHECVSRGGKVLIPVFALGRAQELCILIETYWERMNLKVPIYFSSGLTEKANQYYRIFTNWTNEKIKKTFSKRNMFDFTHIRPFDWARVDEPEPMVLFASPGMLHSGASLEVFKKWAGDEKNMIIMPGYCVAGTVGAKVLLGMKQIPLENRKVINVNLQVRHLSFSAHADAKGILQLIRHCEPRAVMLVHGEKNKMAFLKERIMREYGIPCYDPPNGTTVRVRTDDSVPVKLSSMLVSESISTACAKTNPLAPTPLTEIPMHGILIAEDMKTARLVHPDEFASERGMRRHTMRMNLRVPLRRASFQQHPITDYAVETYIASYARRVIERLIKERNLRAEYIPEEKRPWASMHDDEGDDTRLKAKSKGDIVKGEGKRKTASPARVKDEFEDHSSAAGSSTPASQAEMQGIWAEWDAVQRQRDVVIVGRLKAGPVTVTLERFSDASQGLPCALVSWEHENEAEAELVADIVSQEA